MPGPAFILTESGPRQSHAGRLDYIYATTEFTTSNFMITCQELVTDSKDHCIVIFYFVSLEKKLANYLGMCYHTNN